MQLCDQRSPEPLKMPRQVPCRLIFLFYPLKAVIPGLRSGLPFTHYSLYPYKSLTLYPCIPIISVGFDFLPSICLFPCCLLAISIPVSDQPQHKLQTDLIDFSQLWSWGMSSQLWGLLNELIVKNKVNLIFHPHESNQFLVILPWPTHFLVSCFS